MALGTVLVALGAERKFSHEVNRVPRKPLFFSGWYDHTILSYPIGMVMVMARCVPVKEMKNTATFARLVEEAVDPVTVTKNGKDAFVVMTSAAYEGMQEKLARLKLYEIVMRAEEERAAGHFVEGLGYIDEIRKRHGL